MQQPTLNQFTRVRTAKKKPASNAAFKGVGVRKTKPPVGITVDMRLQQFRGETFCKSGGILFCRSCKQNLPLIKQSIKIHKVVLPFEPI